MAYTLILLGTDTKFTLGRMPDEYDKAETLSYVSQLIKGNPESTDRVTEFRNSNVAVVNGPTTFGTEVGDRIARGVQAILEAISRGETNINIIGHSRGAVEAILVAHELERIQTLLKQPEFKPLEFDRSELTNSVCKYTKPAMNGEQAVAFAALDLENIASHIGGLKLAMLNLDPVPGGNYAGLSRLASLAWQDPRFYVIPKIVKEYEQYIYENERTRCFKPIVPKCDPSETRFKLHSLPGHHGTGSGNLLDQQRGKFQANPSRQSTQHVQQLVVVKIIDFLTRNGVTITWLSEESDPFAEIKAQLFESPLAPEKLKDLYFDLYNKIIENREAYQFYNTTYYAGLGQEQAFVRKIWTVLDQRIVHYQAHNDTYLQSIVPPVPGGRFLNYEHARIHLNRQFGLNEGMPLCETINQSVAQLHVLCRHITELKELEAQKPPVVRNLMSSCHLDPIAPALMNTEGINLLLESLSMLAEEVRQPYLQGKLTDLVERGKIYEEVKHAFILFKQYAESEPSNELANTIFSTLKTNLLATLAIKRKTLKEQYRHLSARLNGNEFFVTLQSKMNEITVNLGDNGSGMDASEHLLFVGLNEFIQKAGELALTNPKSSKIREFIEQEVITFNDMEAVNTELAQYTLEWAGLLMSEAIDDSVNYDIENMMSELIDSHNQLSNFIAELPNFKVLHDSLDYLKLKVALEEKRDHLIHLAAQYIVCEGLNLETAIKPLFRDNEALYELIAGLAVGLGAENPLAPALALAEQQKHALNEHVEALERQVDNLVSTEQLLTEKSNTENEAHEEQAALQEHKIKKLEDILDNEAELQCLLIIRNKLTPLTKDYLMHLGTEIKQSIFPKININDISAFIRTAQDMKNWPENESSQALRLKFVAVSTLYKTLTEKTESKPSEKITQFYQQLNDANEVIKMHRDPAWQRYTTNAIAILSIILTGILPGLAVLAIVSAVTGKSAMFWESSGQAFFKASAGEISNSRCKFLSPS